MTAVSGAKTPQSLCFMNVSASTENAKQRALGAFVESDSPPVQERGDSS